MIFLVVNKAVVNPVHIILHLVAANVVNVRIVLLRTPSSVSSVSGLLLTDELAEIYSSRDREQKVH